MSCPAPNRTVHSVGGQQTNHCQSEQGFEPVALTDPQICRETVRASIVLHDLTYFSSQEVGFPLEQKSTKVRCVRYKGYDQVRVTAGDRAVHSL